VGNNVSNELARPELVAKYILAQYGGDDESRWQDDWPPRRPQVEHFPRAPFQ
jgi:hypothetical protein